jgi:hypothetical protein
VVVDVDEVLRLLHPLSETAEAVDRGAVHRDGQVGRTEVVGRHQEVGAGEEVERRRERDGLAVPRRLDRDPFLLQRERDREQAPEGVAVWADVAGDADGRRGFDRVDRRAQRRRDLGRYRWELHPTQAFGAVDLFDHGVHVLSLLRRVVEMELEIRRGLEVHAPSGLRAQVRLGALEAGLRVALLFVVPEHRVIDVRSREIGRHAHGGDRHEPNARILHLPLDQVTEDLADVLSDALRPACTHVSPPRAGRRGPPSTVQPGRRAR